MQKLYAMFPGGLPGAALLLLRLSVGAQTALCCVVLDHGGFALWLKCACAPAVLLLVLGYLTPLMAALAALMQALAVSSHQGWPWGLAFAIADAVALCLLGPGAFSIDARLFGRRVVVLTGNGG